MDLCPRQIALRAFPLAVALGASAPAAADTAADEAALAREARLPELLRVARARNPELDESRLRAEAASARGRAAARLPDPELKYEQWGVPLERPFALDRADTVMLGVRQALPAWGTRAARARVAEEEAAAAGDEVRARRQELEARVRRAFAEYARTHHELRLHREHVDLTSRLVELARLGYQSGRSTQQDVLRLALELSRLHADVARIEQERRSSQALLNALMNRPPAAPLGPPPEPAPPSPATPVEELARDLDRHRTDVVAGERAIRRDQAALDLARRAARYPTVMVGVDYWYMPMLDTRHGYGAMVSMSLPWLGAGRRAEVTAAERTLRADERALEAARVAARYELEDAAAQLEGAQRTFEIVERDLLPQARRTFESAQAAFAAGQGEALGLLDTLRSYLQVRVERVRAIARIEAALAELDRAAGREVTP